MQWQYVISPLSGAVIGYLTNWIAIKMLFRPLHEKRIFGIKVPFTPGVIPRERQRIAISIGDAVSKYLLTEEQITRTLLERKTEVSLRRYIRIKLHRLKHCNLTVREVITGINGIDEEFLNQQSNKLCTYIGSVISAQNTRNNIIQYLQALTNDFLTGNIGETLTEQQLSEYSLSVKDTLKTFLANEHVEESIKSYLEQKIKNLLKSEEAIVNYIPSSAIIELENHLSLQGPEIVNLLRQYLQSPEVKPIVTQRIEKFIESQMNNTLLNLFSGVVKKSSEKLTEKIYSFLLDEDLQKELVRFLQELLRSLLNSKINVLAQKLHLDEEATRLEWVNWIYGLVIRENKIDNLIAHFEEYWKNHKNYTWHELLGNTVLKKETINNFLSNLVHSILARPELQVAVNNIVQPGINALLEQKISELAKGMQNKHIFQIADLLVFNSQLLIPKYSPLMLKTVNIKSTIQRSVDTLDVSEIENVLLGVTKKELSYITWIGALLGLIIGFTVTAIQSFG